MTPEYGVRQHGGGGQGVVTAAEQVVAVVPAYAITPQTHIVKALGRATTGRVRAPSALRSRTLGSDPRQVADRR